MNEPGVNAWGVDESGVVGKSRSEALRYLFATVPVLFIGGIWILSAMDRQVAPNLAQVALDLALFGAGLALMRWRHRFSWQAALATALLTIYSVTAVGPAYVTYVSLCTHRRWRQIIPAALTVWLCPAAQILWRDADRLRVVSVTSVTIVTGSVIVGGLTIFGLYLRARRDLATSQRQTAFEAQAQRVEQARLSERIKIAHEMHDVGNSPQVVDTLILDLARSRGSEKTADGVEGLQRRVQGRCRDLVRVDTRGDLQGHRC